MGKTKTIVRKSSAILCSLLILLAPLAIGNAASLFLWGEPECPDSLKNLISG